jgi:predicted nucleic-acid-binding Zn-ribbon protein
MGLFEREEADTVEIIGQQLVCLVCRYDRFQRREAQLNTAAASFFNLDWANTSAVCYVCKRCGYIHWFLPQR